MSEKEKAEVAKKKTIEIEEERLEQLSAWAEYGKLKRLAQKKSQEKQRRKRVFYELCYEKLIAEGIELPTQADVDARLQRLKREREAH